MPVASPRTCAASHIHDPIAVPPPASNFVTACFAATRDSGDDVASGDVGGYATSALWLPVMIPNRTPSGMQSMAAAVASLTDRSFLPFMDPEVSTMSSSERSSVPAPAEASTDPVPDAVTVTMACTVRAPRGRNSL